MAHYRCANDHTWKGRSRLSKDYSVADLTCPECGRSAESSLKRSKSQNLERKPRKGMKRSKGFAASKKQQAKVRDLPCIVCGRDRHEATIHAAHVYPRRLQSCECADGVVPLCAEDHARADDQNTPFDLLPSLVTRGYQVELVHAVAAHKVPISELLHQVTGENWKPESAYQLEEEVA